MDDDLVLLRIVVSPEKEIYRDCDLYIYQANGSDNGKPSLRRLPRPPGRWVFDYEYTGLLRCSYNDSGDRSILRSHGINKAEFIIAALCDASDPDVYAELPDDKHLDPGSDECYALYLYNSKDETWSVNLVSLDKQQQQKQPGGEDCFLHFNNKVITIGGEAGTMGFVDLYRGIILCDVLKGDPKKLRYAPLPPPMRPDNPLRGEPHLERDIAVMKGRIKFVEMEVKYDPNLVAWDGRYTNDGWMVWTWSRPVVSANSVAGANAVADDWIMECPILSSDDIEVENNPHFQLLPTPQDNTFRPLQLPPFRGLAVCHPALSLCDDDDTVCLMNKIFHGDKKAWVMAIDVGGKELRGVARFAADRTELVTFAYAHSRISKYLTGVSGSMVPRWGMTFILFGYFMYRITL
ncbi:hypothetical protein QOZ80_5AG0362970 [Eleusine coracana subsp. coracana]|nr:hypothetical protein QOZ80_5AG0362970 [Eleusine coracana subsp. coracana]